MLDNEMWWRLGSFVSILTIMMLFEWLKPARQSSIKMTKRWTANFGLVVVSSIIVRLIVPVGLTMVALYNQEHNLGLFNQSIITLSSLLIVPNWMFVVVSLLILDITIYWQHRLFHTVPMLWRLHRVHHSDTHVDSSTGLRFHPIEIILSILVKVIIVSLFGIPAIAVLIFEIALNGLALFNHANIRLPHAIEKPLRLILMTQILHRIHHSKVVNETNSNYGFSVIWWDKLFGSYKDKALKNDSDLDIGLTQYSDAKQNASLLGLLMMPFRSK